MPHDNPQTPQSPSSIPSSAAELATKSAASPRTDHSLPTPAHSTNGSMSALVEHEEVEHTEVSTKRKREVDDNGDREQKKVHVEDSTNDIGALHEDDGPRFLFLQNPHPPQQPNTASDLFALYGLESLSVSVERYKPDGTKSIKMRKTFKNKVKEFGIAGSFDSIKKEPETPDSLFMMMMAPQQDWDAEHTRGKEIGKGLAPVLSSLSKACTMAKGTIPKSKWDSSVLGLESAAPVPKPTPMLPNGAKTASIHPGIPRSKSELPRPQRSVKRRTYGDNSFEGYGEGYVDSDTHEADYSATDGDDRGLQRKRPKKTLQQGHFNGAIPRQNNYGPSMVGA